MFKQISEVTNAKIPAFAPLVGVFQSQAEPPIWCIAGRCDGEGPEIAVHPLANHESLAIVRALLEHRGYAIVDAALAGAGLDESTGAGVEIWHHLRAESEA